MKLYYRQPMNEKQLRKAARKTAFKQETQRRAENPNFQKGNFKQHVENTQQYDYRYNIKVKPSQNGGMEKVLQEQATAEGREAKASEQQAEDSHVQTEIAREEHESRARKERRDEAAALGFIWAVAITILGIFSVWFKKANSGYVLSYDALLSFDVFQSILFSGIFGWLLVGYIFREVYNRHAPIGMVFLYFGLTAFASYGLWSLDIGFVGVLVSYGFTAILFSAFLYILLKGKGKVNFFDKTDIAFLVYGIMLAILIPNVISWFREIPGSLDGVISDPAVGVFHFLFIMAFGWTFVRKIEGDEHREAVYLWISLLLFVDFMVSIVHIASGLAGYIPVAGVFMLGYIASNSESRYATFMIGVVAFFSFFLLPTPAAAAAAGGDSVIGVFEADEEGGGFFSFWEKLRGNVDTFASDRFNSATRIGGTVEQNQFESLGVYFDDLRAADPRFFKGEQITVWGSIRSKTYQDAVAVTFSCHIRKGNEEIPASFTLPRSNTEFLVSEYEEADVECRFNDNDKIAVGTNHVVFKAEHNFVTDAVKKTYFMDRDRFRSFVRDDIDVFEQFGITDKSPTTIYTNGPVAIGIDTDDLVTVNRDNVEYTVKPRIIVSVSNRKSIQNRDRKVTEQWEGKIQEIKELVFFIPKGVEIENPSECRPAFKEYTEQQCRASCNSNLVACTQTRGSDDTACLRIDEDCIAECESLLDERTGDFKAYITTDAVLGSNAYKDFDDSRAFSCVLTPTQNVLDGGPITTKNFRVRARYNYELQSELPVTVQQPPEELLRSVGPGCDARNIKDAFTAVILQESGAQHCCSASFARDKPLQCTKSNPGNNYDGTPFNNPTAQAECPAHGVKLGTLLGNNERVIGAMQIRTSEHQGLLSSVAQCRSTQDLYKLDCNLALAQKILENYYTSFRSGISSPACEQNQEVRERILGYRDWDAAIRAYYGHGCPSDSNHNYVENVRERICSIQDNEENALLNLDAPVRNFINRLSS